MIMSIIIMSWLKKLLRFGSKVRLVGVDLRGNQYYEQIIIIIIIIIIMISQHTCILTKVT